MLNKLLKSVLDQDRAPIVVCNTDDIIVYMNPSAKSAYHKDLTGSNIKDCHPKEANEKIDKVIRWFMESAENNIIYTYHNDKENKDVYMNYSQVSRHKKAHFFRGAGYFVCSQYKASASFGVSILSVPCGLFVL